MVNPKSREAYTKSPLGWLRVKSDGEAIVAIDFVPRPYGTAAKDSLLKKAVSEIGEYFAGKRTKFTFKRRLDGTPFQQRIWAELQKINRGDTLSYWEIASRAGNAKAVRATGSAIGANPMPIVVPCHRVIASSGQIGGYAGGGWRKKWLLKHESR